MLFLGLFGFIFWGLFLGGGFEGQVRWPQGPPHLALNPPYYYFFFDFYFIFLLSFLVFKTQKNCFSLKMTIFYWSSYFLPFCLSCFLFFFLSLVAHNCGYPLSRYTCRATRVAADFLDFIAFCRCSTGVALQPLKILVSHLSPPPIPGRCRTEIWV